MSELTQSGGMAPGRLERLLEETFWPDKRSSRWRQPTESERDSMSAQESLKDEAHLRVVRRFLDGHLPQQPTPRELAAWVQFCYSHGAYGEAVCLFALIDPAKIEDECYGKLRKIVAVCQARTQSPAS